MTSNTNKNTYLELGSASFRPRIDESFKCRIASEGLPGRTGSVGRSRSPCVRVSAFSYSRKPGSGAGWRHSSTVGINRGSDDAASLSSNKGISVSVDAMELTMLTVVTDDILECEDPNDERLLLLSENLCPEAPALSVAIPYCSSQPGNLFSCQRATSIDIDIRTAIILPAV